MVEGEGLTVLILRNASIITNIEHLQSGDKTSPTAMRATAMCKAVFRVRYYYDLDQYLKVPLDSVIFRFCICRYLFWIK